MHGDSLWNRNKRELRNGLFKCAIVMNEAQDWCKCLAHCTCKILGGLRTVKVVSKRARWTKSRACSGLPAMFLEKNLPRKPNNKSFIDQAFSVLFFFFESDSVHKHAKRELGQYPAILTSRLVNNPYILHYCFDQVFEPRSENQSDRTRRIMHYDWRSRSLEFSYD